MEKWKKKWEWNPYMIVEVPVKIWVTPWVFQRGHFKHNYSPLFIKWSFVTMEEKKFNNSFIPAWILSGAVSAVTSGRVGASARSAKNHTAPQLSDKKKHKKIESVWPSGLQRRQLRLKGGWKRLDLTWRRENAPSCQKSSFYGLWLQLHTWGHTVNSKWLTLWINLDRISRIYSAASPQANALLIKLCTACDFSGKTSTHGGKSTASWVGAATLSRCHSSTGLILCRREGKAAAWQLH